MTIVTPDLPNRIGLITRMGAYTPIEDYAEITLSNTVVPLAKPDRATGILVQARTDNFLFTFDGTNPSTAPGFTIFKDNLPLYIPVNDEMELQVVRETGDLSFRYQWVREES